MIINPKNFILLSLDSFSCSFWNFNTTLLVKICMTIQNLFPKMKSLSDLLWKQICDPIEITFNQKKTGKF